ncbi:hypothetical protein [Xanthomonas phage RTH11]|nr:hypothetical protein [Xanthomonas phage RTH11]
MSNPIPPTPQQRLTALVNAVNDKQWTAGQLVFANPTTVTGVNNTTVEVSAAAGQVYTGNVTLRYNRVDLDEAPGSESVEFAVEDGLDMTQLITLLRARFNVDLSASDVQSQVLPSPTLDGVDVTLTAAPGSFLWNGALTITLKSALIPLADVIMQTQLNGFTIEDLRL